MRIIILSSLLVFSSFSYGYGISAGYGEGSASSDVYRISFLKAWETSCITKCKKRLTGYFDLAMTHFDSYSENLNVYSFAPSFRVFVAEKKILDMFIDLSLGLAYKSQNKFSGRNFGSRFAFEERLGAGFLLGNKRQYEISYRLMHYSNGYLAEYNHGINHHMIVIGYWFK